MTARRPAPLNGLSLSTSGVTGVAVTGGGAPPSSSGGRAMPASSGAIQQFSYGGAALSPTRGGGGGAGAAGGVAGRGIGAQRNAVDSVASLLGGTISPTRRPVGSPAGPLGTGMFGATPGSRQGAPAGSGLRSAGSGTFGVSGSGLFGSSAAVGGGSSALLRTVATPSSGMARALAAVASGASGQPSSAAGDAASVPLTPTSAAGGGASSSSSLAATMLATIAGLPPQPHSLTSMSSTGRTAAKPLQLTMGTGCTQGFRPTMEDAHFEAIAARVVGDNPVSFCGILDGHCGRRVADLGAVLVPDLLLAHPLLATNVSQALVDSVMLADRAIFHQIGREDGGSTLIMAVLVGRQLSVACLGDARAALCEGTMMAVPMSIDHKPTDAAEQQRVRRCGGVVQFGRIGGCLAVSRALGDFEFKFTGQQFVQKEFQVSNIADIRQINITDASKFLILACDGLWDVMSNEEAVAWVNQYLNRLSIPVGAVGPSLQPFLAQCSTALSEYAVAKGSMDNVSVILFMFHPWSRG